MGTYDVEVEYKVEFELIGVHNEGVSGVHTLIDSISKHDVSLADGNMDDLIMSGLDLDVMLAEDIIQGYLARLIGVACLSEYGIWSELKREDDGVYRLGNISVAIGDATSRIKRDNREVPA